MKLPGECLLCLSVFEEVKKFILKKNSLSEEAWIKYCQRCEEEFRDKYNHGRPSEEKAKYCEVLLEYSYKCQICMWRFSDYRSFKTFYEGLELCEDCKFCLNQHEYDI